MKPAPGLMAFHDGKPVEILHYISESPTAGAVWRVRPLFVPGPDRDEVFGEHDRLTPLHSKTH
jgi:hypothetical protein